ncbi:MAG TPA: hypothetical protein PLR99_22175 [Polyangiaceae bacterium]|nr:hypothetical protein [Polyangiaceae bacterium]
MGRHTLRRGSALALLLGGVGLLGCPKSEPPAPVDASMESGAASGVEAGGGEGVDAGAAATDEEVKPVYPLDAGAPEPLAVRLCEAMSARQEARRAECCKTQPGIVLTSECVRMVSAALRAKAVRVEPAAVDACVAAIDAGLAGCEWVGPFPPGPPEACQGLFHGLVPAGARCRSSLECERDLRCHGAGPTTPGKCGPGKADGEACGSSTDALASYARQSTLDTQHPECAKACVAHRCSAPLADGAACVLSASCAPGSQCAQKSCQRRAPSKLGEACPGGVCEAGSECLRGKCAAKRPAGAPCEADFECRGGCVKAKGQRVGTCGMRCDLR